MGEMGKDSCPNVLQPFLRNRDRRSRNDGDRELDPVFNNSHRKCRPSPSVVVHTLKYLVGVPSKAASSRREEKHVSVKPAKLTFSMY